EAAEHDRIVLAVLPDAKIAQNAELLSQRVAAAACARIRRGEDPEKHRGAEQCHCVDPRHALPAILRDERRRNEHVYRSAGGAGTEDPHGEAAPLLGKEASHIGRADREGCADKAEGEPQQEKLPELARITARPDRHRAEDQQRQHDDPAAKAVRRYPERQPKERARQNRHRGEQAEFSGIEAELVPNRDADHAEHHPHGKAHREGEGAREENHQPPDVRHASCHHKTIDIFTIALKVEREAPRLVSDAVAAAHHCANRPVLGEHQEGSNVQSQVSSFAERHPISPYRSRLALSAKRRPNTLIWINQAGEDAVYARIRVPLEPGPLMGWSSTPHTHQEISLRSNSLEDAIAYAEGNGVADDPAIPHDAPTTIRSRLSSAPSA